MKKGIIYIIYIFITLLSALPCDAQNEKKRIHGKVTDRVTAEAIPYASVRIRNSANGSSCDNNGFFSFFAPALRDTLLVSSLGYKDVRIPLTAGTRLPLNIKMQAESYELNEITIKPKKEKYSKKNNPAVILAQKVTEQRNDNSPERKPFYSRNRHEKLNIALNNFNSSKESHFGEQFSFLDQYIDTSLVSGKPILYISAREMIGTDYHSSAPERKRQYIKARKRNGIDDLVAAESLEAIYEETFKDVDIFQDNISIFSSKFVSPLSKLGRNFYRYYILDTLDIDGEPCYDLAFAPFNAESFGFTGHIYITTDSTYFVKLVQMNVPHDINMNFVEYMNIKQQFDRLPDGTRLLKNESLIAEFKVIDAVNGFYAHRQVEYRDYTFEKDSLAQVVLNFPGETMEHIEATRRNEEYWTENRIAEVLGKEQSVDVMMRELRSNPVYYWLEKGITFLFTGWVPLREHEPPVFYGPVNTTFSHNDLEGWRLRTGAMTSAYLNPHLFGQFYAVYGTKDKKFKYMGELEYSFKKKKEHPNEFPIHSLKLRYENDIFQYGQKYLHTNKDNFFLSLKRKSDNKIGYVKKAEFTYTREFYNHFSYHLTLRNRKDIASHLVPFERTTTTSEGTKSTFVKDITLSEAELKLRWAPKEKFTQSKWNRRRVNPEYPVFTLTHTIAAKDFLGSDYSYNHTEFSFEKRFWFSAFGYTNCILKAGKVWDKVPFPLLIMPNANLSYTIQKESYNLMNAMEFFNDEYASWDITYFMNGLIFNRLPLIRKLNWREVISCRGMFGRLSEKNRPNPQNTGELFKFPYENDQYHYLGKEPYVEIGVGVENIFKVLRIDYVRRITYRDLPGIDKDGIRIQFHIQF